MIQPLVIFLILLSITLTFTLYSSLELSRNIDTFCRKVLLAYIDVLFISMRKKTWNFKLHLISNHRLAAIYYYTLEKRERFSKPQYSFSRIGKKMLL